MVPRNQLSQAEPGMRDGHVETIPWAVAQEEDVLKLHPWMRMHVVTVLGTVSIVMRLLGQVT